jgi:hypothetical protein
VIYTQSFEDLLDKMLRNINDHACDYVLSVGMFQSDDPSANLESVLAAVFEGKASAHTSELVSEKQFVDDMTYALEFVGHAPAPYMGTDKHKKDILSARKLLLGFTNNRSRIVKFSFSDGFHPYYPVFLDLAYAVWLKDRVIVFVVSASD